MPEQAAASNIVVFELKDCSRSFASRKLLITGRPAVPMWRLLSGPKMGFAPRHIAPINVKFGTGRSAPRAKFHIYRGRNLETQH